MFPFNALSSILQQMLEVSNEIEYWNERVQWREIGWPILALCSISTALKTS